MLTLDGSMASTLQRSADGAIIAIFSSSFLGMFQPCATMILH